MLEHTRHDGGDEGTVVLLHSLALDRSVWDGLVPLLRDRFTVVTPDLPGHGSSPSRDGVTVEAMADDVAALIRSLDVAPAVIGGLSLGGCVAQAVAARHGDLVRGLALLDTTCWYGTRAPADWAGRAQKAVDNGLDSLSAFQLKRWFSPGFNDAHPEIGKGLLEIFRANDIDDYVAACHAMGAMDLRDAVTGITAPTTVIVGADDPATSPEHAELIRRLVPGASLHVIPECSHLSAVEWPGAIARLLDADLVTRI